MRFEYLLERDWPVQAWLAECHPDHVVIHHGRRVETRHDWFCEAVWDGPFERGDFDQTDIVAGTGGRLRDGRVVFVPTGATTDQLQSMRLPPAPGSSRGRVLVSNSLACLMAAAGTNVVPTYRHYKRDIQTVIKGLERYKKTLQTPLGPARLWYFHNVAWDGRDLTIAEKPDPLRDFSSFDPYYDFLRRCLDAVTRNAADAARRHSFGLMGTMSSGYDSTTVATMGREFGLTEFITFDEARGGDPDNGLEAAKYLGLRPLLVRRDGWRESPEPLPEVPFLTADGYGEDRFFLGAVEHLRNRLMLTGFHGDKIWGKSPYKSDSLLPHPEIKRGDCSGLTMTEFRLAAGFINCPVPFWGCRQIHQVVAISRDPSMKPWDVPGDYSRPICRRIVETAGVPREVFGIRKRAGSLNERALTDASRRDYVGWLRRHGIEGELFDRCVRRGLRVVPDPVRARIFQMFYSWRTPSFRDYFFPWALDRRAQVYRPKVAAEPARGRNGWSPSPRPADARVAVAV